VKCFWVGQIKISTLIISKDLWKDWIDIGEDHVLTRSLDALHKALEIAYFSLVTPFRKGFDIILRDGYLVAFLF